MTNLRLLQKSVQTYCCQKGYGDELPGLRCCELALEALSSGCYGVGALIYDGNGKTLIEARNEVFLNGFHSDRHAEMVALNQFEHDWPDYGDRSSLTMIISLEPCPMCLTRILYSGIGAVRYLAADRDGGMAGHLSAMPPVWRNLAQLQQISRASVSPVLADLAGQIAVCNLAKLREKMLRFARPGP